MDNEEQNSLLDDIRDFYPDSLLADGFNGAVMGVASGCDSGRVVYSIQKMLDILADESDMSYEEAMEYLEFNTISAYVGKFTPIYLDDV
jgi:NH3-dependent NAD+ synthetase|tara:strand:- start:101 stop:367 length:267 start_codon:yes stop_codon:yes gene_type:complete